MLSKIMTEGASVVVDGGRIAVWFETPVSILSATGISAALETLDVHELERYRAFLFEEDRSAYLAAHTLLRQAWAKALGVVPRDVQINRDPRGNPTVISPDGV